MTLTPDQIDKAKEACDVTDEDIKGAITKAYDDVELALELTKMIAAITKSVEHHPEDWMFRVMSHQADLRPLCEMNTVKWEPEDDASLCYTLLVFNRELPEFSRMTFSFRKLGQVHLRIADKRGHVIIDHVNDSKKSGTLYRMIKEMALKTLTQRKIDLCRSIVSFMEKE